MYSESTHGTQATQATIVGMEFVAGIEANIEINRLMGSDSGSFGGRVLRDTGEVEWEVSPDYCNDEALCIEMLEACGVASFILPTVEGVKPGKKGKKAKKDFAQRYIGVFEVDDIIYATAPQLTEERATACVLWFTLWRVSHD